MRQGLYFSFILWMKKWDLDNIRNIVQGHTGKTSLLLKIPGSQTF